VKIKTRSRVNFFKDEVDEIDLQFNKKDGVGNGDKKKMMILIKRCRIDLDVMFHCIVKLKLIKTLVSAL
jgi:hypothetical protein